MLCGLLGVAFIVTGLASVFGFLASHAPGSEVVIPTGPVGFYFVAFTGCALLGWGGCLVGAARRPESSRAVGTATAVALVALAVVRMVAWFVGDYHVFPGELLRLEASLFLVLALAFTWLRPARSAAVET